MRSKSLRERRAIVAGVAGNVMEWYDFSVYGYFCNQDRAPLFPGARRETAAGGIDEIDAFAVDPHRMDDQVLQDAP